MLLARKEHSKALEFFGESNELCSRIGSQRGTANNTFYIAMIHLQGEDESLCNRNEGERLMRQAYEMYQGFGMYGIADVGEIEEIAEKYGIALEE